MKILGKKGLSGLLKIILDLVFVGGILIFASLPITLKWYFNVINRIGNESYIFLMLFLYLTGFFCLLIIQELRQIFKNLNLKTPFIMSNVKGLERMAISSFVISAAYFVKVACFNSFLTIILAMVFIVAGLFCIVLAEVFRQAVQVKEENDLTI